MSIYAKVFDEFHELQRRYRDDVSIAPIVDKLSPDEQKIWIAEYELDEELRAEHGHKPDFCEIVEREIYARGIEPID